MKWFHKTRLKKNANTKSLIGDEEGAVAVEFALTLPIYLALIGMIVEGSWMIYHQQAVNFAAEEATRHALVNYDASTADIEAIARNNLKLLEPANINTGVILVSNQPIVDENGDETGTKLISIQITYRYEPLIGVLGFLGGNDTGGFDFIGTSEGFLIERLDPLLLQQIGNGGT